MNDMVKNFITLGGDRGSFDDCFSKHKFTRENSTLDYSQFLAEVQSGQIKRIETEGFNIYAERRDGSEFKTIRPYMEDPKLIDDLLEANVEIIGREPEQPSLLRQLLVACFPILIVIAVFMFFMRQMQGGAGGRGGPMSFGRSKARLLGEDQIKTTLQMLQAAMKPKKRLKS